MSNYNNNAQVFKEMRERIRAMYESTRQERESALASRICQMEATQRGAGKQFLDRFKVRHGLETYNRVRALCLETWRTQRIAA